ncbi:alcohol dehydrogenase [Pandoraea iniqua]|uniref:Alcohol dehydrogenase n=1 Tax=Pandoraea iniqua TaxID=2508288 RepID=A0A5E4UW50_9BURK|nr:alcohol dehydrogenase [Pandoraea iniqua]
MNRTFQRWEIPSLGLDKLALQDIAMPLTGARP